MDTGEEAQKRSARPPRRTRAPEARKKGDGKTNEYRGRRAQPPTCTRRPASLSRSTRGATSASERGGAPSPMG